MPWKEVRVEDARSAFIDAYQEGEQSMTDLCAAFGVSRKTGYKWLERYDAEGRGGLSNRSRAPKGRPTSTPAEMVKAVLELRRRYPKWGARKLAVLLQRARPRSKTPSPATIGRILKEHGLISPPRGHGTTPAYEGRLRQYDGPNSIWCADFKGWFRLKEGGKCHPLTISDGHSRYLLRCEPLRHVDFKFVKPVFESAFCEFGLPATIRTDNGTPFASGAPAGLSRFSIWLLKLGILPERIRAGKPTQNGRHERMHRTLKLEACQGPRRSFSAQHREFDKFRHRYNDIRPHEALGYRCPSDVYRKSLRRFPCPLIEPEYGPEFHQRTVTKSGEVKWRRGLFFVSEVLRGERVGLRWDADKKIWAVSYAGLLLGHLDGKGRFKKLPAHRSPRT